MFRRYAVEVHAAQSTEAPMSDGGHNVKTSSWAVVLLIVVATILLGVALVAQSLLLAIIGGAFLLVGVVLGGVTHIMDDAY